MAQFLRPTSDTSNPGGWSPSTGSSLFAVINETSANDTPYISAATANSPGNQCTVALGAGSTPEDGTRTLRYRYRKSAAGGQQVDIGVELLQGETVVQDWTHTDVGNAGVTAAQAVTGTITDWAGLRVRFSSLRGGGGQSREGIVSWAELEVPDAAPAVAEPTATGTLPALGATAEPSKHVEPAATGETAALGGTAEPSKHVEAEATGTLAALQGEAGLAKHVEPTATGAMPALVGTADAGSEPADIREPTAAGEIAALSGEAAASKHVEPSASGATATFAGEAAPEKHIAPSSTGTLATLQGDATPSKHVSPSGTGTLATLAGSAEATAILASITAQRAPANPPNSNPDYRILAVRTKRHDDGGADLEYVWRVDWPLVQGAPTGAIVIADGPCQRTGTAAQFRSYVAALGIHHRNAPWVAYWRDEHEVEGPEEEMVPVAAGWHVVPMGRWAREDRTWDEVEVHIAAADAERVFPE